MRYFNSDIATGPIYPPLECSGLESRLVDCFEDMSSYYYGYSNHFSDAGVRCHPTVNPGNSRLMLTKNITKNYTSSVELLIMNIFTSTCFLSK